MRTPDTLLSFSLCLPSTTNYTTFFFFFFSLRYFADILLKFLVGKLQVLGTVGASSGPAGSSLSTATPGNGDKSSGGGGGGGGGGAGSSASTGSASQQVLSSVLLRLIKVVFGSVTLFSDNENVLKPHLSTIVNACLKYAQEVPEPISYFFLLRALFRSIAGAQGKFEALYKEFLIMLYVLLVPV